MRFTVPLLLAAATLAACTPKLTPEEEAQKARQEAREARDEAALEDGKAVEVKGNYFRVGTFEEKTRAIVKVVGTPSPYFGIDLEAAASEATGCKSSFDAGILGFLPGGPNGPDLSSVRTGKNRKEAPSWYVDLEC